MRLPSQKLPKQSNKKIGRSVKHKFSTKALERRELKEEKKEKMLCENPEPVKVLTQEEKDQAKAERKKANKERVMWKKQTGLVNTTAKNGPRAVH
jgi:hypothetical protein